MKIIASMTTIPDREHSCYMCVKSLVEIKPKFHRIVVNIPKTFMRMKKPYPEWAIEKLKALDERVHICRNKKDFGPGTKYFGFGGKDDEFTFICDDDKGYTSDLLQALIRKMINVKKRKGYFAVVQNVRKHKRIMGVHGLLCPPGCIKGYKSFLKKLPSEALEIDDDTFQSFIQIKGIRLVFLPKFYEKIQYFKRNNTPHALCLNRKRRKTNQKILKNFLRKIKNRKKLLRQKIQKN